MNGIKGLKPENVFGFFEELSAVPRGSGKTAAASAFCVDFAEKRGLSCRADEVGNVIIFKGGSEGRESEEPVILQGHLDMVWEKNDESKIDFEHDGITLLNDGEYLFADGTTLGGDDGIAVAMILAVLDDDTLSHPPIEAVFTVDEEVGMLGASALDCSCLKGRRMLNLDSEDESTLWVSCAGGSKVDIALKGKKIPASGKPLTLNVSGLHGGHSGTEIDKGYTNASKLMGKLLTLLAEEEEFMIASIDGGTMGNAITRECTCRFYLLSGSDWIESFVITQQKKLSRQLFLTDPEVTLTLGEWEGGEKAFNVSSTAEIIGMLCELPFGVIAMSREIDGLAETSLNLGILATKDDTVTYSLSVRSAKDAERERLVSQLGTLAGIYKAEVTVHGEYPAWEYKKESALREVMSEVYRELRAGEMTVTAIHAGLECGLFCGKLPGIDCVSFGPNILDIHTPSERMEIASVQRVWEYLVEVLKRI